MFKIRCYLHHCMIQDLIPYHATPLSFVGVSVLIGYTSNWRPTIDE